MSGVRRIPSGSPASYRSRIRLVEQAQRPIYSAKETLLWIGIVFACLFTCAGSTGFVLANVSMIALPRSISSPPIYPNAKDIKVVQWNDCLKKFNFTSNDTNLQITEYYVSMLLHDGWRMSGAREGGPRFSYMQQSIGGNAIAWWGFDIDFSGYTKKTVTISMSRQVTECLPPRAP